MKNKPTDLKMLKLNETALIWDDSRQEFVTAYRRDFKRVQTINFINGVSFDDTAEAFTSQPFDCSAYANGLLFINLDFIESPTHIIFTVQFSNDGQNYFNYAQGPFSDLRYVLAQADLKECLYFPVLANYIKLYALSSGCSSSNKITVYADITFNG